MLMKSIYTQLFVYTYIYTYVYMYMEYVCFLPCEIYSQMQLAF